MSQAIIRELDDSKRYHCAVMFTDIAGFTGLMRQDEQKTIQKLESHQRRLEQLHVQFQGEVVQYYGDGSLSTFSKPLDAIACAKEIQMHARRLELPLRIGIHLGEVVKKGKAIYGDGVNVASRIESVGIPNSILFSEGIWEAIKSSDVKAESLGGLYFKHINKPIKVYGLIDDNLQVPDKKHLAGKLADRRGVRFRTTIVAIVALFLVALGFLIQRNWRLSNLLDDEITTVGVMPVRMNGLASLGTGFRSGLLENMVTNLSSFYGLQVLSSRATESYDESDKKPSEIGAELGVSHLLFGTCRPGNDDSIRINLELVDVRSEQNVWAQSINRSSEDLFENPDVILAGLTEFLKARENPFMQGEDSDQRSKISLNELELIAEVRHQTSKQTEEGYILAIAHLEEAIARDSSLALAHALLAQNYTLQFASGFQERDLAQEKAQHHAGQAFLFDRMLPEAFAALALNNYYYFDSDPEEIMELLQQAVQLRPSYAFGHYLMGQMHYDFTQLELAANFFELAHKLDPDEYVYGKMMGLTAQAKGNNRRATKILKEQMEEFPSQPDASATWSIYLAENGDISKAKVASESLPEGLNKWRTILRIHALAGDQKGFQSALQLATESFDQQDFADILIEYHSLRREYDEAWPHLTNGFNDLSPWLRNLKHMKMSPSIIDRSEFQQFCEELGMDELESPDF